MRPPKSFSDGKRRGSSHATLAKTPGSYFYVDRPDRNVEELGFSARAGGIWKVGGVPPYLKCPDEEQARRDQAAGLPNPKQSLIRPELLGNPEG